MKYEKWSLGYWCLKQYVIFADWLIHKKIIVTGKEKIPRNKPIVFAPNHQNALSDPMSILLHTKFQPVWLARADLYNKSKVTNYILRFFKMVPVYRIRDGKENLEKNEQTFATSIKVLENNFALALFPEAAHSAKRQMLPHKKAVARIVFMAEEKTDKKLDIQIIPSGIFYSHYWKFNRTVIVNFGDPIPVLDFMESYSKNPGVATTELKAKIHDALLALVINIKSKKYYNEFECIRKLYGTYFLKRQNKKYSTINLFKSDQELVKNLDELEKIQPEEIDSVSAMATNFQKKILKHKLRPWLFIGNNNHFSKIAWNILPLLTGFPLFIYGFIFNAIPFFLIDRVIRKKVKDKSFWSTFFLIAGIILFPLFYALLLFPASWFLPGVWLKIAFLVSLPFAGKLSFKWYILLRKTIGRFRIFKMKTFHPTLYQQLFNEKEQLFEKLNKIIPVKLPKTS